MDQKKVEDEMKRIEAEKDSYSGEICIQELNRLNTLEKLLKRLNAEVMYMRVELADSAVEYLKAVDEFKQLCDKIQNEGKNIGADLEK